MIIARSPLLQRLHVPSLPLCWEKGAETRRIITFFPSIFELKDRIICWFYSNKQLPTKEKIPCCKLSASASLNSSGKASSDNTLRFCQADCQSKLLMHFNACLVVQYQRCCSRDTDCKRMQYLHLLLLLLFSKLESNPITNLLLKLAWNAAGKIQLLFCSIKLEQREAFAEVRCITFVIQIASTITKLNCKRLTAWKNYCWYIKTMDGRMLQRLLVYPNVRARGPMMTTCVVNNRLCLTECVRMCVLVWPIFLHKWNVVLQMFVNFASFFAERLS